MIPSMDNIGAFVKPLLANGTHGVTAAGTGDGTKVTGETIDLMGYDSIVLITEAIATLQATETLSIAIEEQQSADGSTWDTATDVQTSTVLLTGGTGGTTEKDIIVDNITTANKKRYIRYNITPDLSASGTDTAAFLASVVKGGADTKPAT